MSGVPVLFMWTQPESSVYCADSLAPRIAM